MNKGSGNNNTYMYKQSCIAYNFEINVGCGTKLSGRGTYLASGSSSDARFSQRVDIMPSY